jgi:hypothetical protein
MQWQKKKKYSIKNGNLNNIDMNLSKTPGIFRKRDGAHQKPGKWNQLQYLSILYIK